MKNIKVKELEVPTGAMPEVVDILIDNDLDNSPTGKDELVFILNTSKALDKNKRGQTAGNSNLPSFVAPKLQLSNQLKERFKKIYELRAFIPVVELPVKGAKVVRLKAG